MAVRFRVDTQGLQHSEAGFSLIISLIMLVILTLLAVSAIKMSNVNLRSVGNTQFQNEATAAAQQAIEGVMGNVANFYTPVSSTTTITSNNTTYTVALSAPACQKSVLAAGTSVFNSAVNDTYWDIQAVVSEARTGASMTIHQGVRVRLPPSALCP